MSMMVSFVLSFFPRDVLDEILNLIESVSEDFPSYSFTRTSFQRGQMYENFRDVFPKIKKPLYFFKMCNIFILIARFSSLFYY